jgi:hypothetical protein
MVPPQLHAGAARREPCRAQTCSVTLAVQEMTAAMGATMQEEVEQLSAQYEPAAEQPSIAQPTARESAEEEAMQEEVAPLRPPAPAGHAPPLRQDQTEHSELSNDGWRHCLMSSRLPLNGTCAAMCGGCSRAAQLLCDQPLAASLLPLAHPPVLPLPARSHNL